MKSIVFASRRLSPPRSHARDRRLLTLLPVSLAWAGISPQPFRTGLLGIAEGQAIRVSLLNAANQGGLSIRACFPIRSWRRWSFATARSRAVRGRHREAAARNGDVRGCGAGPEDGDQFTMPFATVAGIQPEPFSQCSLNIRCGRRN
jgi:hypothetical protein